MQDLFFFEMTSDDEAKPAIYRSPIEFRTGDNMMLGDFARLSQHFACNNLTFVELPVGFSSSRRSSDIEQIGVVLSGSLRISSDDQHFEDLEPGDMFRLHLNESSQHALTVTGENPVRLMVVQL